MNIGTIENLKISKIVDIGAYLVDEENNKVLLPKKQIPKGANINDIVGVFIYKDSEGRLISTTKKPFLTLGNIAKLTVKDVNNVGAFLNIGLERDLLLPYSEQTKKVNIGDKIDVVMYLDKSNRSINSNEKLNLSNINQRNSKNLIFEKQSEKQRKFKKIERLFDSMEDSEDINGLENNTFYISPDSIVIIILDFLIIISLAICFIYVPIKLSYYKNLTVYN